MRNRRNTQQRRLFLASGRHAGEGAPAAGGSSSPIAPALSAAGLAIFVLMTVLVHMRLVAGPDGAVAVSMFSLPAGPLFAVANAISIMFSAEFSLAYALVASVFLWRRGFRLWSFVPLAFLVLTPVEILMKLTVDQPPVPPELHRSEFYPLATLGLPGSFPSGHAIRSGFFCALAGVLLGSTSGAYGKVAPYIFALFALFAGFTRVYLGSHWLSDVIAGLALGASVASLLAVGAGSRRQVGGT